MPRRRLRRILLTGLLLVVVVLLGLHAYNFVRLDAAQLSASAEPVPRSSESKPPTGRQRRRAQGAHPARD